MANIDARENVLFISHNAADRPYALALEKAIHELIDSDTLIDVRYSTSDEAGPQGGEKWREWIYHQVIEARTALIVVTPQAMGKPWLLWEAGACWGATLAQRAPKITDGAGSSGVGALGARLNISIAYGLTENECPEPLRGDQIILGTNQDRMKYMFQRILQAHSIPDLRQFKAGERMQKVLDRYLAAVHKAMLQSPSLATEANIQDWLSRLGDMMKSDRLSEIKGFQRWMTLAFGRDGEAADVPIDVRLHRQLGELYLGQKDYAGAVQQLSLARRAAPRDIYVLRPLVEASMKRLFSRHADTPDSAAQAEIGSLLTVIEDLDPQAFVSTPDAAGLYGKYLRRVEGNIERAAEIYATALRANSNSYYLADLLAQTWLELGRGDEAKAAFRDALTIIARLGERNVWIHGTAATACMVLGDFEGTRERLMAIAALPKRPSRSEIAVVFAGLREVAQRLGMAQSVDELLREVAQRLDIAPNDVDAPLAVGADRNSPAAS